LPARASFVVASHFLVSWWFVCTLVDSLIVRKNVNSGLYMHHKDCKGTAGMG
jgi:hypothetical protein